MTKAFPFLAMILFLSAGELTFIYDDVEDDLIVNQQISTNEFWNRITTLCGNAYEGNITRQEMQPRFLRYRLMMHVYDCGDNHVSIRTMSEGDNVRRTHTFIRRSDGRLELRHDYRNPDGTPANITGHGGFANNPGSDRAQIFPADQLTIENMPSFWNWAWMTEIDPGERYVYFIQVIGQDIVTRTEYNLNRTIVIPSD